MTASEDLAAARQRLWRTLSGHNNSHDVKQNAAGYRDFAEIVKNNAATQVKLNKCKKEMVLTLSQGRKSDGFDDGTIVAEYPAQELHKQAALKAELRRRLAGQTRKFLQNACPFADNSGGKTDVTKDSPITPSGTPFVGRYGYITARNGRITLDQLLAEEQDKADEDSPSPATTSGQGKDDDNSVEGENDWSPHEPQGDDFEEPDEYDANEQAAKILAMYSGPDGRIRKHARKYFLNVNGSGESASDYAVPLAALDDVSQAILYDSDAIDEAFTIAAGRDSGLANYAAMSRLVRLKQREGMELNDMQRDHSVRHMQAMYTPVPTAQETESAILKTMRR